MKETNAKRLIFVAANDYFAVVEGEKAKKLAPNAFYYVNEPCDIYIAIKSGKGKKGYNLKPISSNLVSKYLVKNDLLSIYVDGKSNPLRINNYGDVYEIATYAYEDLGKISTFKTSTKPNKSVNGYNTQRLVRTSANTKLSSFRK